MLRRVKLIVLGVGAIAAGTAMGLTASAAIQRESVNMAAVSAERASGAVDHSAQSGVGESLVIVASADTFASEQEALDAAQKVQIGELQGFYVDRTDNYTVLGGYQKTSPETEPIMTNQGPKIGFAHTTLSYRPGEGRLAPGRWILLSGFRTKVGAQEFLDIVRTAGWHSYAVYRVRKLGGPFIGLGQEAHPNGRGPLLEKLPDQAQRQL